MSTEIHRRYLINALQKSDANNKISPREKNFVQYGKPKILSKNKFKSKNKDPTEIKNITDINQSSNHWTPEEYMNHSVFNW